MADEEHGRTSSKDLGKTTATDITSTSESNADHDLHFARRGEALAEASSSQESIDGYDPELMSGRTLLTAAEEKKLLRKIDWRLMTLCSLIFMFKNLDSNNVRMNSPSRIPVCDKRTYSFAGIQCSDHEQGNRSEYHDAAWNYIQRVQSCECPLLCKILMKSQLRGRDISLITNVQVPYIVLEAPSNLLLKRCSPSKWQSRIMLSWGIALMCNAAVKNKGGLYTTRFLLGVVSYRPSMSHHFRIKRTNPVTGRGWTISRCYSPDDLLVSPGRDVLATTLLL